MVAARDAEDVGDDLDREEEGELGDEVRVVAGGEAVDQLVHERLDHRCQCLERARGERALYEGARSGVLSAVHLDERPPHVLAHLGVRARRVRVAVVQDGPHVVVARHGPGRAVQHLERGHGPGAAQLSEDRVRVREVEDPLRVEDRRQVIHGVAL